MRNVMDGFSSASWRKEETVDAKDRSNTLINLEGGTVDIEAHEAWAQKESGFGEGDIVLNSLHPVSHQAVFWQTSDTILPAV